MRAWHRRPVCSQCLRCSSDMCSWTNKSCCHSSSPPTYTHPWAHSHTEKQTHTHAQIAAQSYRQTLAHTHTHISFPNTYIPHTQLWSWTPPSALSCYTDTTLCLQRRADIIFNLHRNVNPVGPFRLYVHQTKDQLWLLKIISLIEEEQNQSRGETIELLVSEFVW